MTEYQYIYKKKKAYKNAKAENLKPSKHLKRQSHRKEITSDRSITPIDPSRLSSGERRKLLEHRIMELEENQRTINNIQNEIVREKQKSRYSNHTKDSNPSNYELYLDPQKGEVIRHPHLSSLDSPIPENDSFREDYGQYKYISGEKTRNVLNVRKAGRSYRASILDKAEELINARKFREFEYVDENDSPRRSKQRLFLAKRTRTPSSDGDIVEVPEDLDSDASSWNDQFRVQQGEAHKQQRVKSWKSRSDVPSAAQSEIPVLYSDDEDGYPEPRPLTDTADRRYPNYRRYEGEHDNVRLNYRDPAHKKIGRWTGALVRFFRNGDVHHKGVPLTVNRNFKNFETLLIHLNDKIPTPTGVHHIFKWPEGTEIKSVTEFRNRCVYVVASTRELKRTVNGTEVNYGESREEFWRNKKPSAGKMRKHEIELYKKPKGHKESPARSSPLVVTIINNVSRDKREKIILNPQTQQDFDEWLRDIANPDLPIKALYSDKPPFAHIKSFSHLFREHQAHSNFLACGDEFMPVEVMKKRQASSSNSSTDSLGDPKSRRKKLQKQQDMGQIYENGRAESPTSTAMSRYDAGPQNDQSRMRLKPRDSRLNIKNPLLENFVEIEVDGVLREFYPPSQTDPNDDGAKPKPMLKCEWIYGFRGRDTRHNLMVLPRTKELVYYIASVVVLYDKENDTQRHYTKHNEEITCMTMHPNQNLIATGQMHGKESEHASHIRIWDGVTLSDYSVIGLGVFFGGILSVGFSQDKSGIYMCALDASEKHVLSVWDWQTGRVIARTTTSTDPVHSACFYPDGQNNSILITYGARHIYFWKIFYDVARKREAKILRDRNSGIFEVKKKDEVPDSVNCIAFLGNGDVVTGDTSGNLMIWDRDATDAFTCRHMIQAHPAEVMSVCLMEDGTLLSASQNEIKAWDTNSNFRSVKTRQIPRSAGDIMTLVTHLPGGSDGRLYIGTTYNAILDGSLQNKFKYVVQGHSDGVWCVAPHTFEPTFFSAGFDQVVYKWGLTNHKVIWRTQVEHPCTSIATMEKKKKIDIVAVGTSAGCIYILHAFNGMNITTVQVGREPIGSLAFFPDEVLLAVGSNDGLVSVFQMPDKKTFTKEKTSETGHRSGVAHLDWSKDGRCIQSSSFDNELLFWNRDTMTQVETPATMRNVDWFTITCPLSFNLIGPWSSLERGEVLKVACRSPDRDLCIVGDSKGRLRLFKYPCTKERADYRSARIYSSEVTALAFSADNCGVLTCGGNNAALVQWELIEE